MHIWAMQERAHSTACGKGWWPYPSGADGMLRLPLDTVAAKIALIHSEASEALECVRDGCTAGTRRDSDGKPEGLPSELADIVIRVADLAGAMGINLEAAIAAKMAYNEDRTHRHGGKGL